MRASGRGVGRTTNSRWISTSRAPSIVGDLPGEAWTPLSRIVTWVLAFRFGNRPLALSREIVERLVAYIFASWGSLAFGNRLFTASSSHWLKLLLIAGDWLVLHVEVEFQAERRRVF